jgi:serine/threonine-protein kinase
MVSRAYPSGNSPPDIVTAVGKAWDLAARANRLEGEVATHTRKLEALERRGRALRAEIGRKVEELAHEESRVLREGSAFQEEAEKVRTELVQIEKNAQGAKAAADNAERGGQFSRAIFERAGAAEALISAKREWLQNREGKQAAREATARDLRRQIEELRAQLSRYAEALEEDLGSGREKVAARTREGLTFEKQFTEVTNTLIGHLKSKPECRDLLIELSSSMSNGNVPSASRAAPQEPPSQKMPGFTG